MGYPVLIAGFALALRASAASYGDQTMSNLTPFLTWRGRIASLCLALLLAVGIAARAVALPNPQDSVRSFYDTLLTTMKSGATLGERGRYARLAPVIDGVEGSFTKLDTNDPATVKLLGNVPVSGKAPGGLLRWHLPGPAFRPSFSAAAC